MYAIEEVPGLHLLPPGSPPPNPAEVLDSVRGREVLASYAERYDVVVVDSPPVLPVTDATVLSQPAADGVLLVVAYRSTFSAAASLGPSRSCTRWMPPLASAPVPWNREVPADEGYGGQGYRYDTYRSRGERRRVKRARLVGTARAAKAHARHLSHEPTRRGPRIRRDPRQRGRLVRDRAGPVCRDLPRPPVPLRRTMPRRDQRPRRGKRLGPATTAAMARSGEYGRAARNTPRGGTQPGGGSARRPRPRPGRDQARVTSRYVRSRQRVRLQAGRGRRGAIATRRRP